MHGVAVKEAQIPGGAFAAVTPENPSDDALLARIAQGERIAFALLVERHTQRFYRLAYRSVFQQAEAEDIVQEAFLKLWSNPGLWKKGRGASFTTWFYRMVINLCHDHNKRKRPLPMPEEFDAADVSPDAETVLLERRRQAAIEAALRRLPERQRDALNLCFYQELSNRDAAEILGVRVKALESLLMRAKAQLREELKAYR